MEREIYYENCHVIDRKDYLRMMKKVEAVPENRLSKTSTIRKIYFNQEMNYLEPTSDEDKDVYSIVVVDKDLGSLVIERKSCRSGMIYKDYLPITEKDCRKLLSGDFEWLKDSPFALFCELYREITINHRSIGAIVDYERQRYKIHNSNDYMEFDLSVKSTDVCSGDLLCGDLDMKERLEKKHIVFTYKQSVQLPPMFKSILSLTLRTE